MSEQQINEARKIIGLLYMFHDVSNKKYLECLPSSSQLLKDHLKNIENIKFEYYEYKFKICKDEIFKFLNNICYDKLDNILENLTSLINHEDTCMIDAWPIYLKDKEKIKISQTH